MSLKVLLNNLIAERGYVSSEEVYRVCLEEGYKLSNAERRLRKSESPNVEPVMAKSKRGTNYIRGYQLIGADFDPKRLIGGHYYTEGGSDMCCQPEKQKQPTTLFPITHQSAINL